MSKLVLFDGLSADLIAIPAVKKVALWNNQPTNEDKENPYLYPAVFIEFLPAEYRDLTEGVQEYDMITRLHICFESYKDQDTAVLTLVDTVYKTVHRKRYENFTRLLRRGEEQNFDHDNVQDYIQDYITLGKDFGADQRATTEHTVTDEITPIIIEKAEDL